MVCQKTAGSYKEIDWKQPLR